MKQGFEHGPGVMARSIGAYCRSKLKVMTLGEVIHTVKHTGLHLYHRHPLTVGYGGQCHFFCLFISVTSHPCLAPGAHCRPAAHECVCVIDSDPRFICVSERMRQSEETDTSTVGETFLSELTSHPQYIYMYIYIHIYICIYMQCISSYCRLQIQLVLLV